MIKNLRIIAGVIVLACILFYTFTHSAHAAPNYVYQRTILPEITSSYDLGTSTKVWRNIYTDSVCLSADCRTSWPTGGAGAFPFTPATSYGVNTSATTTALWGAASIFGSSTSATRPAFAASNSAGGPAGIFGQGSVGIGTTSPGSKLSVAGGGVTIGTTFSGVAAADGNLHVSGNTNLGYNTDQGYRLSVNGAIKAANQVYGSQFSFTTDSDTGLFNPTANTLALYTNNTERVRVDSSGNVGIGTTSPQNTLHVYSAGSQVARFAGPTDSIVLLEDISVADSSRPFGYLRSNDGKVALGNANRSGLSTTGSVDRLTIDSTGNVGIGTTSPNNKLHISDAAATDVRFQITNATTGFGASDGLHLSIDSVGDAYLIQREAANLKLYTNNTPTSGITINSSGSVGIGNASPLGKLDVSGNILSRGAAVSYTGITNAGVLNYDTIGGTLDLAAYSTGGNTSMRFTTSNAGTPGTRMTITSAGLVGIGTASPDGKLHISGTTAAPAKFVFERSDGGSGAKDWVQYVNAQHNFLIGEADDSGTLTSQYFTVADGGNVGIGTTSPYAKLSIVDGGGTNDTTLALNDRFRFSGDGVMKWGTASNAGILSWDTNVALIGSQPGNDLVFLTNGTGVGAEKMRITTGGNVGIGTTSPTQRLSVQGNGLFSGDLSLANLTATGTIQAATLTLTNALAGSYGGTGSTTLSGILAGNGTSGVKTAVIGSGLSWDGTTLAATGGSSASSTLLADVNTWSGANTYGAGLLRSTSPRITTSIFDANGATILGLTPVASASNYVTVTNSNAGTPGIGTNSGAVPLNITGGGGVLTLTGDGTGTNGLTLNMVGSAAPVISPTQSNTSLVINSNGSGSIQLNGSSGKVGVGTTSPAAILSVGAPAGTAPLMVGSTTKTLLQVGAKGKLEVLDVGTGYSGVVSSLRQLGFQTGTTTTWTGSTTGAYINKLVVPFAGTIRQAICDTDTGTLGVDIYHTSTHLAYLNASTTKGTVKFTSNNTVTAGETLYMVAGTPASSPTSLTCTIGITETP